MDCKDLSIDELWLRLQEKQELIERLQQEILALRQRQIVPFELAEEDLRAAPMPPPSTAETRKEDARAALREARDVLSELLGGGAGKHGAAEGAAAAGEGPGQTGQGPSTPAKMNGTTLDGDQWAAVGLLPSARGVATPDSPRRSLVRRAAMPALLAAAALAAYGYFRHPGAAPLRGEARQTRDAAPLDASAQVAKVLTEAERQYILGDYDGCRKTLEGSGLDAGPYGQELLQASILMSDPDSVLRRAPDPMSLRGLSDLLRSNARWRLRQMAARRLGDIRAPRSIAALSACLLDDRDWGVRCEAADSLARLGEPEALQTLEKCIEREPEPLVRIAAGSALQEISRGRPAPAR